MIQKSNGTCEHCHASLLAPGTAFVAADATRRETSKTSTLALAYLQTSRTPYIFSLTVSIVIMALLTMSSMPSVMLKTPTPSPSGIPEAAVNDSGDWRDILNKYTGWFITAGGSRIVITLDYSQLRISEKLSEAQGGAITSSYDLSLPDGDVSEAIMTKANLETVNFGDLKDMVKAQSGADVVLFSIEEGEVTGVGFNGKAYETTDPGVCSFLKLSVELRASVWKDILVTDQGYVVLKRTPDKENSVIISADLKVSRPISTPAMEEHAKSLRLLGTASARYAKTTARKHVSSNLPATVSILVRWDFSSTY
jgi:hypothetical protein